MSIFPAGAFATVENHRERERGVLVYPVYSRRSGGLSVGINLFPGAKACPFDCPYCEVFPFSTNAVFSQAQMEEDLRAAIADARRRNAPVRDICFSGNGEPSLSPDFPQALQLAARIRAETAPEASLVLITNGAGLLQPALFSLLKDAAFSLDLDIWLKVDAATAGWYHDINRCAIPFKDLMAKIREFVSLTPVTIQTMLCAIDGKAPPDDEARAWETLLLDLSSAGHIRKVQLYGKARPAPEDPMASALPDAFLEERASSLRRLFTTARVEVYY